MPTYIVTKREYSEKARKHYGSPWIWRFIAKTRLKPPQDEVGFFEWLKQLIKGHGSGEYAVSRTQVKSERRGFHPVGRYIVSENSYSVKKRFSEIKSHPGLPNSRQLFHKGTIQRQRLRKRGKNRFN